MRLEVEFDGRKLRKAEDRQATPRDFLLAVADHMAASSQKRFRDQRAPDGSPWPARMVPNVAGIVRDLEAGRTPQPHRFRGRPALVDSGALRDTIRGEVHGKTVEIVAPKRYGAKMQEGGTSTLPGAKKKGPIRSGLARFLANEGKRWAKDLGWLFSRTTFTVRAQARPFLGMSNEDDKFIETTYAKFIRGEAVV